MRRAPSVAAGTACGLLGEDGSRGDSCFHQGVWFGRRTRLSWRSGLTARLDGDDGAAVVSAPAGHGQDGGARVMGLRAARRVAWLSCDPMDAEPTRFHVMPVDGDLDAVVGTADDAFVLLERVVRHRRPRFASRRRRLRDHRPGPPVRWLGVLRQRRQRQVRRQRARHPRVRHRIRHRCRCSTWIERSPSTGTRWG